MDFGRIRNSGRPITLAEWTEIIRSNPTLQPVPDREGVNPFTQEKVVFSGEGKAYYVVGTKRVGNASLEDGEILTSGIPRETCEEIAGRLDALVLEDDRS